MWAGEAIRVWIETDGKCPYFLLSPRTRVPRLLHCTNLWQPIKRFRALSQSGKLRSFECILQMWAKRNQSFCELRLRDSFYSRGHPSTGNAQKIAAYLREMAREPFGRQKSIFEERALGNAEWLHQILIFTNSSKTLHFREARVKSRVKQSFHWT